MKTIALTVIILISATSSFADSAKKVHCQMEQVLQLQGWNPEEAVTETVRKRTIKFIPHQTDQSMLLSQETVTIGSTTVCVQQEVKQE